MAYLYSSLLAILLTIAFLSGYFFPNAQTKTVSPSHIASKDFTLDKDLPDFRNYNDIQQKKTDFFMYLLPLVQAENAKIEKERAFIKSVQYDLNRLSQVDMIELQHLANKYKVEGDIEESTVEELLKRVNTIPASLVLAQAANESAWGTSRFARKGNNLFGQWCYVKGCGIVPKHRSKHQKHEVAKFSSVQHSVASYMLNLNSQFSYDVLRDIRANNSNISGHELAYGLIKYSTRREAYVHEIQLMIRQNGLHQYD